MECKWGLSDWQAYFEDLINEEQKHLMENHLSQCSSCLTRYEHALIQSMDVLEEQYGEAPDFTQAVMEKIQSRKREVYSSPLSFIHYGIAASIAILLFNIGIFDDLITYTETTVNWTIKFSNLFKQN